MALVCPACGNAQVFMIKTAQAHLLRVTGSRVDVLEETQPVVAEALCGECDTEVDLNECDEAIRRELLLTIGAA